MSSDRPQSQPPRRRGRRLVLLCALLALTGAALVAQRLWLSDEARERRLAAASMQQLERQAPESRDPLLHYHLARRRIEVGDLNGAISALEAVLRLDPRQTRARATLGTVLMSAERDQEAFLQLRQALEDDPTNVDAYLGLALFYQRQEAWGLQADAAKAATEAEPEHADAWILRGEAAIRQQDYGLAEQCFSRAAAAAPGNARAHALAAHAQLALGRVDQAERMARAAAKAQEKEPLGHAALGEALLRQSRLEEAEAAFERAIALGEPTGAAALGLARALQRQERHVEAEQQFRLALRANAAQNQARYGLTQVLRAQGKEDEAAPVEREFREWTRMETRRVVLNDRIARNPGDPKDWFALAEVYCRMRLWPHARRTALSGLRRAPADPRGQKLLAEIDRNAR